MLNLLSELIEGFFILILLSKLTEGLGWLTFLRESFFVPFKSWLSVEELQDEALIHLQTVNN
jgi:hypothetical protein